MKQSKELTLNLPTLREDQIIGRQDDLTDLLERLFSNKQVVVVNGMGGIGKTTIAQVFLTKFYIILDKKLLFPFFHSII